jgi:hypothetical protein
MNLKDTLKFIKDADIIDEKIPMSEIERAFNLTNVEDEDQEDNPNTLLCRFEFFEIICRLGHLKFFEKRRVDTIYDSIVKILNENVFKLAHSAYEDCHLWRQENIYVYEIDQLLKANVDELDRVLILSIKLNFRFTN